MDPTQPYRRLVSSLMALLEDPGASDEALGDGAEALLARANEAPDLLLALMARGMVRLDDFKRAAFGALVTGALVEMGADPRPAALALATVVGQSLPALARFQDRGEALNPAQNPEDREARAAWEAMGTLYRPAVAILGPTARGRDLARTHLGEQVEVLRHHKEGGWFVWRLLRVLEDEPLRVILPAQGAEARVSISGVADNLQLQVLLMDALPRHGVLTCPPLENSWLAVALGKAPQQMDGAVRGAWKLASPAGPLPLDGDPADIPLVDGERTLILHETHPPPTWRNSRIFASLPAKLTVDEVLHGR